MFGAEEALPMAPGPPFQGPTEEGEGGGAAPAGGSLNATGGGGGGGVTYSAAIPGARLLGGQMVRWYITAAYEGSTGPPSRLPASSRSRRSPRSRRAPRPRSLL